MATNEQDDFLAGLENDNSDPFQLSANDDIFSDEKEEVIPTDAKPVPFAKDEKIQRYIDRQIEKRTRDLRPTAQETFVKEVSGGDEKIVSALTRLVGNDTDEKRTVLEELKSAFGDLKGQAKREAIQEFIESQQNSEIAEQRELNEAFDELEEGRESIEDEFNIQLTDKQWQGYKNYLSEIEPAGGYVEYPNFVRTFNSYRAELKANRPSNAQNKALASRGMERSSSNSEISVAPKRDGTKSLWQMLGQ
jgi:hypothetical protein